MDNLHQKIAKLSPEKRAILEQRLKEKKTASQVNVTIPKIDRSITLALSFAQQRMWFIEQLEPGNAVYNRPTHLRLTGDLKVDALEQSLNEIIRRHEVLRASFPNIDGQPIQAIADSLTLSLPVIDLRELNDDDREEQLRELVNQENQAPFNLGKGPLIRAKLLQLKEEEHVLLLTFHHIIFDGWSEAVLLKELTALYDVFAAGKPSPLADLPIQYADFTHWQREKLNEKTLQSQLAYWKSQLDGELPILELPTDRRRSPLQTFRGAKHNLHLSKELSRSLKSLSLEQKATAFMTLLAAFQSLLYRYTGNGKILIGTPVAGREQIEVERLIGIFINTIVLRSDFDTELTFESLLHQVKRTCLTAFAHQELPFERLLEELKIERNLSHTPIFQVLFQLRNSSDHKLSITDLTIEKYKFDRGIAAFDLTLDILDTSDGFICSFEYNRDLFDSITIERMAGHYQTLLQSIVSNPQEKVSKLSLLTQPERYQLLTEWNNTTINYPQDKCIHQLFEEQVERTPEAIAVIFEDQQLTYRELNNRANQLAHYLQSKEVKADTLVGICIDRSPEMIIGLLGILKAGGVYVPLDPNYPSNRLAYILQDASIIFLLTEHKLIGLFSSSNVASAILLDIETDLIAAMPQSNLRNQTQFVDLAYVIYTSGSTGQPKGVLIEHKTLASHCQTIIQHYQLTPADRILQFAAIGFDVSLEQILPTLITGASLILADTKLLVASDFDLVLEDVKLTVVNLPPIYWNQWLKSLKNNPSINSPKCLRLVICGGDEMGVESLEIWEKSPMNSVRLLNAYGPTETTITALTFEICKDTLLFRVPIGRPLKNRKTYILDSSLQPVPIGVAGELHIGGMGLARGYLNRPELTKEKFIPNIFSQQEGDRLYKTGDLARYLPDGNIEFLGRIDNQVKIRGFRIELGEIEATLSEHEQIKEVVAIAREDIPGEKRIVAYLVAGEITPQISELRSFLKAKLPDYMVPSAFIFLEVLPLTPNGKIDRRALPAPDPNQRTIETQFVAPRTSLEKKVSQIWCDVLKLEKVGIYDNFFELGGHSLLATRIISQIRQSFQIEFPLRSLFEHPTIAEWTKEIDRFVWLGQQITEKTDPSSEEAWEEFEL